MIYELGRHRLACADATDREIVGRLLADAGDEVLFLTDPPYSSGARQEAAKRKSSSVGRQDEEKDAIHRDNLTTVGYQTLMLFVLSSLGERVCEALVFTDWRMWAATEGTLEALGLPVISQVVWDKIVPGLGKGWRKRHELVAHAARTGTEDLAFEQGRPGCRGDVIQCTRDRVYMDWHPTPKPVKLITLLLANTNYEVVYDPFAGSGSTILAAEGLGRRAFAVELEPRYCDLIRWRWGVHARAHKIDPGPGAL